MFFFTLKEKFGLLTKKTTLKKYISLIVKNLLNELYYSYNIKLFYYTFNYLEKQSFITKIFHKTWILSAIQFLMTHNYLYFKQIGYLTKIMKQLKIWNINISHTRKIIFLFIKKKTFIFQRSTKYSQNSKFFWDKLISIHKLVKWYFYI